MSTCFRWEGLRETAEAREEQPFSVIPQPDNLQRNQDFNKLLLMLKNKSTQRENTLFTSGSAVDNGDFRPQYTDDEYRSPAVGSGSDLIPSDGKDWS